MLLLFNGIQNIKTGPTYLMTVIIKKYISQRDKEKVNNKIGFKLTLRVQKKSPLQAHSIINQSSRHNTMICLFNND